MGHNYREAVVSYSSSDSAMIAKLASQGEDEWLGESQQFASSYIRDMSVKRVNYPSPKGNGLVTAQS